MQFLMSFTIIVNAIEIAPCELRKSINQTFSRSQNAISDVVYYFALIRVLRPFGDFSMDRMELVKTAYEELSAIKKYDHRKICNAVKPVCEAYRAAKVEAEVTDSKGVTRTIVFYNSGRAEESCQTVYCSNETPGVGAMAFTWICLPGESWDERDENDLGFLSRLAFVVSERLRLNEIARDYYYHDTVTGLGNINSMAHFAASLTRKGVADRYIAAFINVSGFNYVNRKVGYQKGTQLLKQYGTRLSEQLDPEECVARLGGDNFVLLFKKEHREAMEEIFAGMTVECRTGAGKVRFNLSAKGGLYLIDDPHARFDQVMIYVSSAFNYARNYARESLVEYSAEVAQKVIENKEYLQRFSDGLKNGEFFVVYQPKVYTKDNTLYGGEALVRWNCDGKIIYPGDFIEVLEKEHLVSMLDFFVLEETCRNIKSWVEEGIAPVKISINFSNDHLLDEQLVEKIVEIVDRYGVDHKLIEIELTETADYNEIGRLLSYVEGLHRNGFTAAIDDFGIGYSSLQILQSVSVDVLKIDKSFVTEITADMDSRENIILKHIINLADELGVEIVAEGVETGDQKHNLTKMNCNRIQGYIYDKPLNAEDFRERMTVKNY